MFIDKVTTGTYNLALLIWNVASEVGVNGIHGLDGLAFELAATSGVL